MTKILVADKAEMIPLHRSILEPRHEVIATTDVSAAVRAIADDVALIVCGVHFDDSRMFEFFSRVGDARQKAFVCFRGLRTPMVDSALQVIKQTSKALGSAGFIDYVRMCDEHGNKNAGEQYRECIEQALKGRPVECE